MSKAKSAIFYIFNFTLPILMSLVLLNSFSQVENPWQIFGLVALSVLFSFLTFLFKTLNKTSLYRLFFLSNIIMLIIYTGNMALNYYGLSKHFSSIASFKHFLLSTGEMGMFVYVLIQFLQVMFLPIPSMIINLAGVAIYGPWIGALLCTIGVLSASYCSFFMGKIFGFKIAKWVVGEENTLKYAKLLDEKGRFFLAIAFLLPLFPDDVLCLVSGITTMKFKTFFIIATITRPIGIICMSLFGGGYIIPFTGWGLFVWPFLLVFIIVAVVLVYKYQTQLENFILSKLKPKKQKNA